jgi:hypothetical protein
MAILMEQPDRKTLARQRIHLWRSRLSAKIDRCRLYEWIRMRLPHEIGISGKWRPDDVAWIGCSAGNNPVMHGRQ